MVTGWPCSGSSRQGLVLLMPEAGGDTGHRSPALAASLSHHALPCSAAQRDPPVPWDPTRRCHSPSCLDKEVEGKQMTWPGEPGGRHNRTTGWDFGAWGRHLPAHHPVARPRGQCPARDNDGMSPIVEGVPS